VNILYIDHYAGGPAYGMEYRPHYFAREWARDGHSVTIVAASHSHVRSKQPTVAGTFASERVDGVKYVWCSTPAYRGNNAGRVVNIFAFLRRLYQSDKWLPDTPDAVIASSTYPLDIWPARRLARRHGALLVWEVHDLWPLSPIEIGGMSPRHPFVMLLQRAEDDACRHADAVVSILPCAASHLEARGMARAKFTHIPNGIDPLEWEGSGAVPLPAPHAAEIAQARAQGRFLVAYAGAHGPANALHTLVEAAAALRDEPVTFLLVGDGSEKRALQRRVQDERLMNVRLLDPVPKAAIPMLLQAMDALYIGLRSEPLFRFGISPNKLMDYMMSAKPVICAIRAGNDPVAEAGCGLTIAPEDPAELGSAVRRMAAMTAEDRARMGEAGRRYVAREHLYPVLARRFMALLLERRP